MDLIVFGHDILSGSQLRLLSILLLEALDAVSESHKTATGRLLSFLSFAIFFVICNIYLIGFCFVSAIRLLVIDTRLLIFVSISHAQLLLNFKVGSLLSYKVHDTLINFVLLDDGVNGFTICAIIQLVSVTIGVQNNDRLVFVHWSKRFKRCIGAKRALVVRLILFNFSDSIFFWNVSQQKLVSNVGRLNFDLECWVRLSCASIHLVVSVSKLAELIWAHSPVKIVWPRLPWPKDPKEEGEVEAFDDCYSCRRFDAAEVHFTILHTLIEVI